MARHTWQAALAVAVWAVTLQFVGVPLLLAILVPVDIALVVLAAIRWRALRT